MTEAMNENALHHYQRAAMETAIYPHKVGDFGLAYAALGLVNEVGEYMESTGDPTGELGDIAWYWAALLTELESGPHAMFSAPIAAGTGTMQSLAAEIAGKVKKVYRDQWSTEDTTTALLPLLGQFIVRFDQVCFSEGLTLDEVLGHNLAKLGDRQARGVLKGSGDNR